MIMEKKSTAVFAALVFAMALASPALAADAAAPPSFQHQDFMKKMPQGNPGKSVSDGFSQPAKPGQPMPAVRPIVPPGQTQTPAQPPRPIVKTPGPAPQDPKKNATFVNKVNTAPATPTATQKATGAGYNQTQQVLGR